MELKGYMPFDCQWGFVFVPSAGTDAAMLSRTAAHEVGHGMFNLRHIFSDKNIVVLSKGNTDNLMDYPSTSSGQGPATRLCKYQWDYIHDPQKVWFKWLEKEDEGAYIDENCFKDPKNYYIFKGYYEPLKKDPIFMKVFKILNNSTKLAYCFDELTDDEIEENSKPNKIIAGGTEPFEKATFIGMRNIKTHKKYWFKEVSKLRDERLLDYIVSEEWKGRIGLNMKLINSYVIFHELNHAVQDLLELEGKTKYSSALKEVETRMICFYAAFLQVDAETRKDYLKMREFLISFYKNSNIDDLMPLTGDKIFIQFSDDKKPKSDEEIYSIIYDFFSGLNKENNDFNKIMTEYADWIKNFYGYTYNPDEFKPNYYLYNLIK